MAAYEKGLEGGIVEFEMHSGKEEKIEFDLMAPRGTGNETEAEAENTRARIEGMTLADEEDDSQRHVKEYIYDDLSKRKRPQRRRLLRSPPPPEHDSDDFEVDLEFVKGHYFTERNEGLRRKISQKRKEQVSASIFFILMWYSNGQCVPFSKRNKRGRSVKLGLL